MEEEAIMEQKTLIIIKKSVQQKFPTSTFGKKKFIFCPNEESLVVYVRYQKK
jgi:hypothetical protein